MINIGSILPVGTIIHSMLSTAQFATEYGDNWVLADGRSVTGTKYALVTGLTTLPDMRGAFLRGKNNGSTRNPDGDLTLGIYSADKFASHNHTFVIGGSSSSSNGGYGRVIADSAFSANSASTGASGGNETAPKSITVNIFIKIN